MKKTFKRVFLTAVALVLILVQIAYANVIVAGAAIGTLGALTLAAFLGGSSLTVGQINAGYMPTLKPNIPALMKSAYKIERDAFINWVYPDDCNTVMQAQVKAVVNPADIIAAAASAGFAGSYPKLNAALNKPFGGIATPWTNQTIPVVGQYINTGTLAGTITGVHVSAVEFGYSQWCGYIINPASTSPQYYIEVPGGVRLVTIESVNPNGIQSVQQVSQEEFAQNLCNASAPITVPTDVYSDYYGELDDFIHSNPNVIHFEDGNGNEVTPPPAATAADIANRQTKDAYAAAVASAQTAAVNARSAANAARALAIANPTNTALEQAAQQAERAAEAAEANLAKTQAEAKASEASTTKTSTDDITAPSISAPTVPPAYGDASTIDFGARFSLFLDRMKQTPVFQLPGQMIGSLPAGGTSLMTINCGRFGSHTFDFSTLSSVFIALRTTLLVCMSVVATKIVMRGGAG